jgi:hypothetical protein
VSFVQKTLDFLPAFAGLKAAGTTNTGVMPAQFEELEHYICAAARN